jgi:hypothetical protein
MEVRASGRRPVFSRRTCAPVSALATLGYLATLATSGAMGLACLPSRRSPPPSESLTAPGTDAGSGAPTFRLTASIRELMDSEIDPAADYLWDAVASISTQAGMEERQPRTAEAWHEVRRHALTLIEATNLLVMRGRKVSATYLPAASPDELDSAEAQRSIEANWESFVGLAQVLGDVGTKALVTIDAKDPAALFEVGSEIDAVCESCHVTFWYPKRMPSPTN